MAVTIKLKNASGSDPSASDLVVGEVALRTDSGKLFTKKDDGSVAQIGGGAGSIDDDAVTTAKIADGAVTNAKVASDAAIALSKLATGTLPSGLKVNHNNLQTGIIENENISSSAAIAGSKISPNFGSSTITGGNLNLSSTYPSLTLEDTNNNSDYRITNNDGQFIIYDITNSAHRLNVNADGHVDILGNLDVGAGIDVTGSSKLYGNGSASVEWGDTSSLGHLTFSATDGNPIVRAVTNKDLVFQVNQSTTAMTLKSDGDVQIPADNAKLQIGASQDLEFHHNGSSSFISNSTGFLFIHGNDIALRSVAQENYIVCDANDAVELYFDNTKRFETSNSGATVTGTLVADGFTGPLTGNVTGNTSGSSGSCTGNAATATALETARTIAGVSFDGSANISLNNNAITNGAGYITATLTNEQVQDIVGGMVSGNTESGITVTYQDGDGTLDFSVASQTDQNFTTTLKNKLDGIASGATNVTNNNQLTNGAGYSTFSGSYNDLSNTPTIPTNNNQLSNGAGYITSVSGQNYNSLSNLPTIPSNNNQLSNGAGYITSGSNRAAQAWVNFRGNSSVSINDDANVSSVSDNGTGQYTVNFSSSMPNSSYCVSVGFMDDAGNSNVAKIVDNSLGTGSFQIRCGSFQDGSGNTDRDFDGVFCSIFAG